MEDDERRLTLLFQVEQLLDDGRDAGELLAGATAEQWWRFVKANFDPDEPRDDHGRWTDDGDSQDSSKGGVSRIDAPIQPHPATSNTFDPMAPEEALRSAAAGVNPTRSRRNCGYIIDAVIARLRGSDSNAVAPDAGAPRRR